MIAAAATNLICGMGNLVRGGLVEEGVLTFRATNFLLGALCLVILAVYLIHGAGRDQEDGE